MIYYLYTINIAGEWVLVEVNYLEFLQKTGEII